MKQKLLLFIGMLGIGLLLLNSCITEVDISEEFETQYALNGAIYSDTFSVFKLHRINRNETYKIPHARVWIEDDNGNEYLCKYHYNDYRSEVSHLPESEYFKVFAKSIDGVLLSAEVVMPINSVDFGDHSVVRQPKFNPPNERKDSIDLITIEIDKTVNNEGILMFSLSHTPPLDLMVNPGIVSHPVYYVGEQKSVIGSHYQWYLQNATDLDSLHISDKYIQINSLATDKFDYLNAFFLDKTLVDHYVKSNKQVVNDYNYGELSTLLPPIQSPNNVEGGFGFVTAIRNVRIKLER